jgi:4-amino-4-deoxy-L-arabinose transferase-like glycosyltransferase
MISNFFNKHLKDNWAFISIYLVSIFAFVFYVLYDNTPPHWDAGRHIYNAQQYWQLFKNIFVTNKQNGHTDAISSFFRVYYYYPPFVYWVSLPFMAVFGRTYQAALFGNIFWLSSLSFFWVSYSKLVGFSKTAQNVALMFLLSSPFVIGNSRELQLDIPVLAALFGLLYAMEKLIQKISYPNMVIFAAALSCGLVVKWSYIVYAPALIGLYMIRFLWINKQNTKALLEPKILTKINVFIYIIATSLWAIAGSWYLPNLTRLKLDLTQNGKTAGINEGDPQGITIESLIFYLKVIINEHFWLLWLLFLAVLIIFCAWKIRTVKISNLLLKYSNFGFVFLVASLNLVLMLLYHLNQPNKDTRYAVIFYVSWIIMIALLTELFQKIYVNSKKFELIKKILLGFASIIFIANIFSLTLPLGKIDWVINKESKFPVVVIGNSGYTNYRTRREDWAIYKALATASNLKNSYLQKADSCIGKSYFSTKLTVAVDFEEMPLHTNYGTVWGLAEQYGLEISGLENPCFILVGKQIDKNQIEVTKFLQKYELVDRFEDFEGQGLNIVLLKKKVS